MRVSIALASYNGSAYLQDQLDSFLKQYQMPDELIVTDDCSSDTTEAIVRAFAERAPFQVEFHRNERNLGYSGNFNQALMKTTGDLVFLSDQDDVWFPEKIAHMVDVAERHPDALVVMNDAALTDGQLNDVGLTKLGQIRSAGLGMESFVMGCCCGVKRELLDMCLPIPDRYKSHDNWIVGLADGLHAKVVVDKPLQYYRRHGSNESQFIANRTKRVTKLDTLMHSVRSAFDKDAGPLATQRLEQQRIFADGVNAILMRAPERYRSALLGLEDRCRDQISTIDKRMRLRRKPFLRRTVAACRLFVRGKYRQTSGIKGFLRDVLIRDV